MLINNNISALLAYDAYKSSSSSINKAIKKLSSGLRINSAADDAAGLAISEKMRAQIRGLDQAVRNSQDGISMIQTAEGALQEVHSILQRMRELSIQAANDTLTQQDRGYIQLEVDQLKEEADRIANTTQFNKKKLLDGSSSAMWTSDKLTTQAFIRGALSSTDQFGQKITNEGNYRITITAAPGVGQVQKSHILDIRHDPAESPPPEPPEPAVTPRTPTGDVSMLDTSRATTSGAGLSLSALPNMITQANEQQTDYNEQQTWYTTTYNQWRTDWNYWNTHGRVGNEPIAPDYDSQGPHAGAENYPGWPVIRGYPHNPASPWRYDPNSDTLYISGAVTLTDDEAAEAPVTSIIVESGGNLSFTGAVDDNITVYSGGVLSLSSSVTGTVNLQGGGTIHLNTGAAVTNSINVSGTNANVVLNSYTRSSDNTLLNIGNGVTTNLILNGSNSLTSTSSAAALTVTGTATLNISGSGGSLQANGGTNAAGIGGSEGASAGYVNIFSGNVTAAGNGGGAGIGGGSGGGAGSVFIKGGTVTANGGASGAGIGGGQGGSGGRVTITGGDVTARSGGTANSGTGAAIGGGQGGSNVDVYISGGTFSGGDTINGSSGGGAAIGSGVNGSAGEIRISRAGLTANGGAGAAGIGGGSGGSATSTHITANSITANGNGGGAGIGGGNNGSGGYIYIDAATLNAAGAGGGAGIGGGSHGSAGGDVSYIGITDAATTSVTGSGGAAAIGGGNGGSSGTIDIVNSTFNVTGTDNSGNEGGAAIGGGAGGNSTLIQIRDCIDVTAQGGTGGAGIGGGSGRSGGGINLITSENNVSSPSYNIDVSTVITDIKNKVTATGGGGAAGIGGGMDGNSGTISVWGGEVTAAGGDGGAGIGGGLNGSSGTTNIYGRNRFVQETITAAGSGGGAGIGGGKNGSGGEFVYYGNAEIETFDYLKQYGNIYGPMVIPTLLIVKGSEGGAGIGGGDGSSGTGGNSEGITLQGGRIDADGGDGGGAAVGSGKGNDSGLNAIADDIIVCGIEGTADAVAGASALGAGAGGRSGAVRLTMGNYVKTATSIPGTLKTLKGNLTVTAAVGAHGNIYEEDVVITKTMLIPVEEISKFYDSNGVFTVEYPQKLTIRQGDGKTTSIVLYRSDTMDDLAWKINDAIANDLGQGKYVPDYARDKFCTISDGTQETSEAILNDMGDVMCETHPDELLAKKIGGTMLIRSIIPGAEGELSFSGDEDLLHSLGLATLTESRESEFNISVYDAHSGKLVAPVQTVTGSTMHNALNNVDIKFDPLADTEVTYVGAEKSFVFTSANSTYTTYVHLADNTTTLQIGSNEGEELAISFGNVSVAALGIKGLSVVSQELAARAVTVIDNAIDKVSQMRANLGSYQNRLEHTIANLTLASENLTASESRIRDADMAREMMEFTKLNILLQSGASMMTQANQLPQVVLSLMR